MVLAKAPTHPATRKNAERLISVSKWWQFTLSALAGAIITLVSIVLAFAGVSHDAAMGAGLAPRVHALELRGAATDERWKALNKRLDKQDALLEKLAK